MSFCEFCGKQLEDGQVCACQYPGGIQQQPPAPPVYAPPQATQYGPQQAPPPYDPPQQSPPPQFIPPQASPQYGPPQYSPPQAPPQPGATAQTFNALKDTLGGFAKDPYGAATRAGGLSMSVSVSLLALQVIAFALMIAVGVSRFLDYILKEMGVSASMAKEYKKEAMDAISAGEYIKIALCAAIGIGALFLCIFLACKMAKIQTDPKTMLSSMAMSSIMMSAAFVTVIILLFLLGFSGLGVGLYYMAICMGSIASLLLLEISLRGIMPPNTGNVKRLVCLTVSYAVSHVATIFLINKLVYENALVDGFISGLTNSLF